MAEPIAVKPPSSEPMIPLSRVVHMIEAGANKAIDTVLRALGIDEAGEPKLLSSDHEQLMQENGYDKDECANIRTEVMDLPVEAQARWIKAYAARRDNTKTLAIVQACKLSSVAAWHAVHQGWRKIEGSWKVFKAASLEPMQDSERWLVRHENLVKPTEFPSKQEAVAFALILSAGEIPQFKSLRNPDGTLSEQFEDAAGKAIASLPKVLCEYMKTLGHDEVSAEAYAEGLVKRSEAATPIDGSHELKPADMPAESIATPAQADTEVSAMPVVQADTKQVTSTPEKPSVSGLPTYETAKQVPGKGAVSGTGGFVSTEKAPKQAPSGGGDKHSMKSEPVGKSAQLAAESDRAIDALVRSKGLSQEMGKIMASARGKTIMARLIKIANATLCLDPAFAAAMTDEARDFVSAKIAKLVEEGKDQSQASAIAFNMARDRGFDVPAAPK